MSTPENETQVLNLDELKEIMDDDMELIQECFSDFLQDWPELYVAIKKAVLEKNAAELDAHAHRLKGTLRYLAAEPAAQAAWILESAGKNNDMDNLDAKLADLKDKCMKLVGYIKQFKP